MTQPTDENSSEHLAQDAVEARMRRALDFLSSEKGSPQPAGSRQGDPKSPPQTLSLHSGSRPRRRFVEDGEVAVTVVSRQPLRSGPDSSLPSQSRLTLAETALDHERSVRQQTERDLHEALAVVHALETKLGHAELKLSEASGTARDTLDELRTRYEQEQVQLRQDLTTERSARLAAEHALAAALTAHRRVVSAVPVQTSLLADLPAAKPKRAKAAVKPRPVKTQPEPKPVKWWR